MRRRQSRKPDPRSPIPDFYFEERAYQEMLAGYDVDALRLAAWSPRTICGRDWVLMMGGEGGQVHEWGGVALAPTCAACIGIIGKRFEQPAPHERLDMLATLLADAIAEFGSAEVRGTPGDQLQQLRQRVRKVVRSKGYRCRSYVQGDLLLFTSDDAYDALPEEVRFERERAAAEAVHRAVQGERVERPPPAWRFRWSTWMEG